MSRADGTPPLHDPLPERRTHFLYVRLPEDIEPDERHDRYATMLDAELRLRDIGEVTGGGSMMRDDEDGNPIVLFCGVDVEAYDQDAARAVLREHLPSLGCKPGTMIEFRAAGASCCDRYDGDIWWLALDTEELDVER